MGFERVFITGANGLLGQSLIGQLSSNPEYDILATGRQSLPNSEADNFGYISCELTDFEKVGEILDDFSPSVIVNCAAMTGVDACEKYRDECWKINVDLVEYLARHAVKSGSRLIQMSTDFVFDGKDAPYSEDDRPNPLNFYGRSKLAAENAVRLLGERRWTIARIMTLYGSGNELRKKNIGTWLVSRLSKGKSVTMFADQYRSPSYVVDVANYIERLIRFQRDGVFHISGPEIINLHNFALLLADTFDFDRELISKVPSDSLGLAADRPKNTGFITLRAESELGYRSRSLKQALIDFSNSLDISVSKNEG